jgi:RimJ/RimL family protein N-acetyltransferase
VPITQIDHVDEPPGMPGSRSVTLDDHRTLTVRAVRPDDAEALGRLYGSLSLDDRYHRFFSVYQPGPPMLEHMAQVGDEGGFGLVAIVTGHGRPELVGEASFTGLPNGNAELAITIARAWQGWLGPFLLDALVEAATARGIPKLEADVMAENVKMLALVRARGYETVAHADPSILRVAIGAAQPVHPNRPAST